MNRGTVGDVTAQRLPPAARSRTTMLPKDKNDKPPSTIPIWASVLALILVPVIVSAITSFLAYRTATQAGLVNRETKKLEVDTGVKTKMIELALEIVKTDPKPVLGNRELRGWAADVLNQFADVKLTPQAKEALVEQPLFGETYAIQRLTDTPLSRLITDTMRQFANADVALLNAGAVRSNWMPSVEDIRPEDVERLLPFKNTVCAVRLNGAQIRALLDLGAKRYGVGEGRLLQVSGIVYSVAPGETEGKRICEVRVVARDGRLTPLSASTVYTVALNDFLLRSPEIELGEEASKILEGAPIVIQPGEGAFIATLVTNRLQRRAFPDDLLLGRVSVGCFPSSKQSTR